MLPTQDGLERVVVTGMGVVAPNGIGLEPFWTALKQGRSAISKITRFDATLYNSRIAGEIKEFDPAKYIPLRGSGVLSRFAQMALVATRFAIEDSGLRLILRKEDTSRIGVVMGTAVGGFDVAEEQHKIFIEKGLAEVDPNMGANVVPNSASGFIAIYHRITGPNITISTSCSSGLNAIGYAFDLIRYNRADVVIAGGAEAPIAPLTFGSFALTHSLSTRNNDPQRASRPFDRGRDGFVISEGAGIVILESMAHAAKRGARIYGEIKGYGSSNDAYHISGSQPSGEMASMAIKSALDDARLGPDDIDYVCAHGSGYPSWDIKETKAIKIAFGDHAYETPVSSIKSMIGHAVGAGGALQLIASVLSCGEGVVPPTINYEEPDPDCDLDYVPNVAREKKINNAMCNAFGYGGNNAVIIVSNGNGR
jgi:3-oxoacyl-[acyl-carrier-protein] synthase II